MSLLTWTLVTLFTVSSMAADTCDGSETCQPSAANIIAEDDNLDSTALLQTEKKKIVQHQQDVPPTEAPHEDGEFLEVEEDVSDTPDDAGVDLPGESKPFNMRDRLNAHQMTNYDHLHSLLKAVNQGHVDAINGDAFVSLLQGSAPSHVDMKKSDAQDILAKADTSKDGKLQKNELDALLQHTIEDGTESGKDEIDANSTTGGTWEDWSLANSPGFWGLRYSTPTYFKPRVMYQDKMTFKQCYAAGFILTSNCWAYMYTAATMSGSTYKSCRCFPNHWKHFDNQGRPKWLGWWNSNAGNHIYCNGCTTHRRRRTR